MRKLYVLALLLCSGWMSVNAQVPLPYSFSKSSGTYAAISGGTVHYSGTAVATNGVTAAVTIPSFVYNGTAYTSIYISNNGFITFGSAATATTYNPISSATAFAGAIAGYGYDLVASTVSGAAPEVMSATSGSEFVIQYKDVARTTNPGSDRMNFQIRLNTTTNEIKVVYGTCAATATSVTATNFGQIGLRGATNSSINNLMVHGVAPYNSWAGAAGAADNGSTAYQAAADAITGSNTVRYISTVLPVSGQTYTWTPMAASFYQSIPYTQNFDTWSNYQAVNDVPGAGVITYPATGNTSWRNLGESLANGVWNSNSGQFTGTQAGTGAATFNQYSAASATTGNIDFYLNLSPAGSKTATFYVRNPGTANANDILRVYLSTDAGLTFSLLQTYAAPITTWTAQSLILGTTTSATCILRFQGVSDYGSSSENLGIDELNVAVPVTKPEPTNQPTNLTATGVTVTAIVPTWTAAVTGTQAPDGYLIKASNTSLATITDPVDGTDPADVLAFTGGLANRKQTPGTATTTATFTNTAPGTMYYYKAYSYTNTGSIIDFKTTTPATMFNATKPNAATVISLTGTSSSTGTISWTAPASYLAGTNTTLAFVKSGATAITVGTPTTDPNAYTANTVFASGTAYQNDALAYCVYKGDGTTVNITGLAANTTYQVLILAAVDAQNSDLTYSYSAAATTTGATFCNAEAVPTAVETFTTLSMPACWGTGLVSGTINWAPATTNDGVPSPRTGTYFLGKLYTASDALAFSQPIDMTTANVAGAQVNLWIYRNALNKANDRIRVWVNTSKSLTGATQILEIFPRITVAPTVAADGWYNYKPLIPLSYNASNNVFIIIEGTTDGTTSSYGIGVDDVLVENVPACQAPPAATGTVTGPNSANLSWTASASAPTNGYQWEVRTSGAGGSGATGLTASNTTAAGVTTATTSALAPSNTYTLYVRSDCGGTFSSWTASATFTTPANPLQFDFAQAVGTYSPISATNLFTATLDDEVSSAITIPSFTYNGTAYTTMYVAANGWLTLGATAPTNTSSPMTATTQITTQPTIVPYSADLGFANAGSPSVSWTTVGNEIVVQWQDVGQYASGGSTQRVSFQARLNTVTGEIKFVYGGTITATASNTYQVGIRGNSTTYPTQIINRTNTLSTAVTLALDWAKSTYGTSNSSTMTWSSSNKPDVGLTYTFTPNTCVPFPTPSVATAITDITATANWAAVAAAASGYEIRWRRPSDALTVPTWATPTAVPSGTSYNITGLTASTVYIFEVRSKCSAGSGSIFSNAISFQTADAPCITPTAQPTLPVFSSVTATTLTFAFTAASPAPSKYLVVRTLAPAAATNPVNGTAYTVGATALGGTIVSISSSVSIAQTGLTANTLYNYTVFSYNDGCFGAPNYLTSGPLTGQVLTCAPTPITNTITAPSASGFTINWAAGTGGTGGPITYTIDVSSNATFTAPVAGSPFSTAGLSQVVGGLSSGTQYWYRISANNGVGGCSSAYLSGNTSTVCGTISTFPWNEGFEGVTSPGAGIFPNCWSFVNVTGTNSPGTSTTNDTHREPRTGTTYAYAQYNTTEWTFTPAFTLATGSSYDFSFWLKNKDGLGPFTIDVAYGTAASAAGMTNALATAVNTVGNTTWTQYTYTVAPGATGTYYFGIKATSTNTSPWYLSFDDFKVDFTPACAAPTALSGVPTSPTDANLSWTAPVSAPANGYEWEVRTSGAGGSGATGLTTGSTTAAGVTTATTGSTLAGNTTYTLYVRSDCGGVFSTWSASATFTTPPPKVIGTIVAVQQTGVVGVGSVNNNMLRINIPITGTVGTQTLNSIVVTSANTNDADVSGVTLWTGTATAPGTQLGGIVTLTAGAANFTGLTTSLATGNNYLWVLYDIAPGATPGNLTDAKINAGDIAIAATGGATAMGTSPALDPAGNRPIVQPLCGGYTINNTIPTGGTNYISFTDAINDLNLKGVSCATTFSVKDGQTFNETVPAITVTGTAANTITFVRDNSTGTAPLLQGVGGAGTTDAVLQLNGTDYLVWDGINIGDNTTLNTTDVLRMEYGVFLNGAATNGCKNNTFRNFSVSLTATNANLTKAVRTLSVATNASGSNSTNKFYNLKLSNAAIGYGFDNTAASVYDDANEVNTQSGGTSTISSLGGTTVSTSYGVQFAYQTNFRVWNTAISGITGTSNAAGIISASSGGSNTSNIQNNTIKNITGQSTTAVTYGIRMLTNSATTISSNTITGISAAGSILYAIGVSAGNLTANANIIGSSTEPLTATLNNSVIEGIDLEGSGVGTITNNVISYLTGNGVAGAQTIGIYTGSGSATITGNTVQNISSRGANTTYPTTGIFSGNTGDIITNNIISNVTAANGTNSVGILGASGEAYISGNQISNITSTSSGAASGVTLQYYTSIVELNVITGLSSTGGSVFGIYDLNGDVIIEKNQIRNLTAAANTKIVMGIVSFGEYEQYIEKNVIDNLISQSTTGAIVAGIHVDGYNFGVFDILNNMVSNINADNANNSIDGAVRGISVDYDADVYVDHNTVYLSGTATKANLQTAALWIYASSTSAVGLRDNILYNNYGGIGKNAAINFSGANASYPAVLWAPSNNNLLYAGTPTATTNVIFRGNTSALTTLADYQGLVGASKETASFTINYAFPFIQTTVPANLHVDTLSNRLCEISNKGIPVSYVTTDIDDQLRSTTTPDVGADEWTLRAPDKGVIAASATPACGAAIAINGSSLSVGPDFSYQWQVNTGSGFTNITDAGIYTGSTTATLGISNTTGLNGYQYQLITNRCSPATATFNTTAAITLNVLIPSEAPTAAAADNLSVCSGTKVTLSKTGGTLGAGGSYNWYNDPSFNAANLVGTTTDVNATLDVYPTITTTYYLRIEGSTSPCAPAPTAFVSVAVAVKGAGTWLGNNSTWTNAANWCNGNIPGINTDVIIPAGVSFYPIITTGVTALARKITLEAGATSINIDNGGLLEVHGDFDNKGTLANNGTIKLAGNALQTFPGTGTVNDMRNLEVDNTGAGVKLTKGFGITNELKLTTGNLELDAFDIAIRSTAASTAHVSPITSATISYGGIGRFSVERFINTGNTGAAHGRTWQLLSVPTNSTQSINSAWQEGLGSGVPGTSGLGTRLSSFRFVGAGAPNGFDEGLSTSGAGIKTYLNGVDQWDNGPNSTTEPIANPKGWMVFVRGDRTVSGANIPTGATTLRTRGALFVGQQPAITIPANKYESIGNPYASAVDLIALDKVNVTNEVYVWDPKLGGAFGFGRYRTLTFDGSHYLAVPSVGTYAGIVDSIQSGQAFFLKSNGLGTSTVQFKESDKRAGSNLVNRGGSAANSRLSVNFSVVKADGNEEVLDGVMAIFNNDYSRSVDVEDGTKIMNNGENSAFRRDSKLLTVERLPFPVANDTLHLDMISVKQTSYNWQFVPYQLDGSGRSAWLIDRYLNTTTPIDLTNGNSVRFTVDGNAASSATDRFKIVFKVNVVLPVTITSISATRNPDRSIKVKWSVENELNIDKYEVERSADGIHFSGIITTASTNSRNYSKDDLSPLSQDNYYRIKATGNNGQVQYSAIVKVAPLKSNGLISIYPNPVEGKIINLRFTDMTEGSYQLQLTNKLGQVVYNGTATVTAANFVKNITLGKLVTAGTYQMKVVDADGKSVDIQVLVQ